MAGELNLRALCRGMAPLLQPEAFVYCCVSDSPPAGLEPVGTFREAEGLTVIVSLKQAVAAGLSFEFEWAQITLEIHSALEAVGFIATISGALAKEGIPCNVVSAWYHDHLFVPYERRHQAMQLLRELAQAA